MKMLLMVLPLMCAAGAALAQGSAPDGAPGVETMQEQEQPQAPAQAQLATRPVMQRQGADMRRCLQLKSNRAIIRCAERGRKP